MNTLLIIYPHWPPSNLVGVHRVRLLVNEMPAQGWKPIVLTVDPYDYEEPHAEGSEELVIEGIEVHHIKARPIISVLGKRTIGDLGLRAWHAMKQRAHELCSSGTVDAIWFSLPSFYPCLMGPELYHRYGIPYAIDYQDPWIQEGTGTGSWWHRSRWTDRAARWLEPRALRQVAFLSAINAAYMAGPLKRHPHLRGKPHVAIQLGFSEHDHQVPMPHLMSPWDDGERVLLYAGTYWEQGAPLFEEVLIAWKMAIESGDLPNRSRLVFIGTGHPELPPLLARAETLGIHDHVTELPERIPFLHVQELLRRANASLVIGSTSKHYSASKVFQLILAQRPVVAHLHPESEAGQILQACGSDAFLNYYDDRDVQLRTEGLASAMCRALKATEWSPNLSGLASFSASHACAQLLSSFESSLTS